MSIEPHEVNVNNDIRQAILTHYTTHSELYDEIWSKLYTIHNRFLDADRNEKITYLKLSYINAVISIRTPASIQDEAITRLMSGESFEEAMSKVNYQNQKQKYMIQSLNNSVVWRELVSFIESDAIDSAHEIAVDQLKYIGAVKGPFIFAMLGYTEKMCLDGNVIRVIGLEDHPSTSELDDYERFCQEIREEFPALDKKLDPFHLHWVIFDWMRYHRTDQGAAKKSYSQVEYVTTHDAWFDAALAGISDIHQMIDSIS